ncbi:MAG: hypothetical protein AB1665_05770 [Candidatus Thermoplasmatota archaeon]
MSNQEIKRKWEALKKAWKQALQDRERMPQCLKRIEQHDAEAANQVLALLLEYDDLFKMVLDYFETLNKKMDEYDEKLDALQLETDKAMEMLETAKQFRPPSKPQEGMYH